MKRLAEVPAFAGAEPKAKRRTKRAFDGTPTMREALPSPPGKGCKGRRSFPAAMGENLKNAQNGRFLEFVAKIDALKCPRIDVSGVLRVRTAVRFESHRMLDSDGKT